MMKNGTHHPVANIGACLLERHQGSEQRDIKDIGLVVSEIVSPGLADEKRPDLFVPKNRHMRQFLLDTQTSTIQALLQVSRDSWAVRLH